MKLFKKKVPNTGLKKFGLPGQYLMETPLDDFSEITLQEDTQKMAMV